MKVASGTFDLHFRCSQRVVSGTALGVAGGLLAELFGVLRGLVESCGVLWGLVESCGVLWKIFLLLFVDGFLMASRLLWSLVESCEVSWSLVDSWRGSQKL